MGKSITDLSSVTTVGLDLAKHVFQVHGVDASGRVVVAKAIRRNKLLEFFASLPPCLVGLEACGSAHHWARELITLGHDARLMPPAYVKAYVRRQKNDAADAAAICEAVTRPSMRFVPLRSLENQAALMHHRVREMLVAQRTQVLNAVRGHLAEIGVIAAQGPKNARDLAKLTTADEATLPWLVRAALAPLVRQLDRLDEEIGLADDAIKAMAKADERARSLMSIPGIGPVTASAIPASVQDVSSFSGGKERLGRVSKTGNRYLRKLLVVGAHAVLYNRKGHDDALRTWACKLMETKPFKLVAVALANKLARIAFAILRDQTPYSAKPFSPALDTSGTLRELVKARGALIKDRVAALNRQAIAVSPLIKRQLAQRLRQIDGQVEAIDRRLKALRNADSDLCQRFDIWTSIPGIGEVTANVLVVETPELGRLEHAQAASLAGLAPVPRDSGQTHGKRSIRGGRPRARQALYMPALNAIRLNPEFKAKYEAMVKAGKPAKVAIVAIMRKLLILANALIRDRRKWVPANP